MDVNLIIVILTSFLLVFIFMSILFAVENKSKNPIRFFSNEKYHKYIFFVILGIILFLTQIMILNQKEDQYLGHIIMITIMLILFRRGVVDK